MPSSQYALFTSAPPATFSHLMKRLSESFGKMRTAQSNFFSTRKNFYLIRAKELEKQVDSLLATIARHYPEVSDTFQAMDFLREASTCRASQKAYFKTKSQTDLIHAKLAEKAADTANAAFSATIQTQPPHHEGSGNAL